MVKVCVWGGGVTKANKSKYIDLITQVNKTFYK